MTIATFEEVIAWQKGKQLYTSLYRDMVSSKDYFFRDQLLRATLSITNNIAEGFDRGSHQELRQFLIIARGSAAEVRSMLLLAAEVGAIPPGKQEHYILLAKNISRLLTGFIKSLHQQNADNRQQRTV